MSKPTPLGDQLRALILKRLEIEADELDCPRAKSYMTPCVARDGDLAASDDGHCVGCNIKVEELLAIEQSKEKGVA